MRRTQGLLILFVKGVAKMLVTRFYYDIFDDEYVLNRIENAPPERYIETVRGPNGACTENWEDGFGQCLTIAYSEEEYYNPPMYDAIYNTMCTKNMFKPRKLRYFVLPESRFDEVVRKFGLCEGGQT